jgi:hypothetical protein
MFDRRLGLALGKSENEIRALPYPEYRRWQLHYMLEPWGWQNLEYLVSAIMAMMLNVTIDEKHKKYRKSPGYFMRNMEKLITDQLNSEAERRAEIEKLAAMSREEKREYYLAHMRQTFGGGVSRPRRRR